ncbi:hypothetical protein [Leptolyngbya sp. FACHB-261]|uniref:hypothetical protein n=1 Tax=Leptolyngbya sp. FACHB-261 TaxID=2692806 RepID=UPI00168A2902|nr:hypothetical protein [Leptolyngbya sp. FACHB-261]MBD2102882.1 hypothetical protein [Leptolyngbya sp. FACHB-261]
MNVNEPRSFSLNFSGLGCPLFALCLILLLSSVGLGWLVKASFVLLLLLPLVPVVLIYGFQWWFRRNLVTAACPICSVESQNLKGVEFRCPSCGEPLKAESQQFVRLTPPGTIEVQAQTVDIQSNVIEIQAHEE